METGALSSVALDLGTVSGFMASSAFSDDVVGIGVLTVTFSLAFDGAIECGR